MKDQLIIIIQQHGDDSRLVFIFRQAASKGFESSAAFCFQCIPVPQAGFQKRRHPFRDHGLHVVICGEGQLLYVHAVAFGNTVEGALIREDGRRAYPIRDGFPILLLEAAIDGESVSVIAIGNGTASRETEQLVAELITERPGVQYAMVSEAGASVYSASKLARAELPGMDVSMRGAVSIARRLQDPMAELVKIDPRSIGIGLYQHDVDQKTLSQALDTVV